MSAVRSSLVCLLFIYLGVTQKGEGCYRGYINLTIVKGGIMWNRRETSAQMSQPPPRFGLNQILSEEENKWRSKEKQKTFYLLALLGTSTTHTHIHTGAASMGSSSSIFLALTYRFLGKNWEVRPLRQPERKKKTNPGASLTQLGTQMDFAEPASEISLETSSRYVLNRSVVGITG